jgi:hypothetical protein
MYAPDSNRRPPWLRYSGEWPDAALGAKGAVSQEVRCVRGASSAGAPARGVLAEGRWAGRPGTGCDVCRAFPPGWAPRRYRALLGPLGPWVAPSIQVVGRLKRPVRLVERDYAPWRLRRMAGASTSRSHGGRFHCQHGEGDDDNSMPLLAVASRAGPKRGDVHPPAGDRRPGLENRSRK